MDKYAELYEKIVAENRRVTKDLDELTELAKAEGYECGKLAVKHAAIMAFDELSSFIAEHSMFNLLIYKNRFIENIEKRI